MKGTLLCLFTSISIILNAQSVVVDWSTLVNNATGVVNTSNTPNAVVNISGTGFINTSGASPRYNASSGSSNWAMNGLGLGVNWTNATSAVTVDIEFTIPVCTDLSFVVHDLNGSNSSTDPFEDKITVNGYDQNSTLIPINATNYSWSTCSGGDCSGATMAIGGAGNATTQANTRIGRGTNGCYGTNVYGCTSNRITFTLKAPTVPKKIKRVTIIYSCAKNSPDVNAFYTGTNPAYQNIVISNITAVLPPTISTSFACSTNSTSVNLSANATNISSPTYTWTTSTGTINSGSNALTANVKSPGTYTFTAYNGAVANGCSTQTVISLSSVNCSLLSVELMSYFAERVNEGVKLNWKTLSEKNNDFFTVERSLDGYYFEPLKQIKGGGSRFGVTSYEVIDDKPDYGVTYYRLKQTDYDGQYKYSDVVSVDIDDSKVFVTNVFPNPTSSNFDFEFYTPIAGILNYEITDYTGRVLISKVCRTELGKTIFSTSVSELPTGFYFLKISFDKKNYSSIHKILKN